MSKYQIINLIDKLFVSVCIFLLIYAWLNFFIRNLWTTFILSLIFSFAIIFLLFYFLDKCQTKSRLKKKKQDDITLYNLAFQLMNIDKKIELLKSIIEKKYSTSIDNQNIIYTKDNKKHIIVFATDTEKLNQYDFYKILQNINPNVTEIEIVCNTVSTIKTKILKGKNITIIDKDKLYYDYFEPNQIYPDISNIDTSITKFSWHEFALNIFSPNKARGYFWAGVILLFSSIIIPYYAYYIIFGSVLIIFSIICKLLPLFKKNNK